jgi:hypothetical protein
MMFFGDRCTDAIIGRKDLGYSLTDPSCHDRLAEMFARYGLTLNPPRNRA